MPRIVPAVRRITSSSLNSRRTRSSATALQRAYVSLSPNSRQIASAQAAGCSGGTTKPDSPSATVSGNPPTSATTQGMPRAIASITLLDIASRRETCA